MSESPESHPPEPARSAQSRAARDSARSRRLLGLICLVVVLLAFQLWSAWPLGGREIARAAWEEPSPVVQVHASALTARPALEPVGQDAVRNSRDGSILVRVPAGPFLMGSNDAEAYDDEKPLHQVVLEEFWIGRHAVTNEQFQRFVSQTGYQAGPRWRDSAAEWGSRAPVVHVSWKDAQAYCTWAGLRLPTEAEWEKAARGTSGRKFPWGDRWEPDRAWFLENSDGRVHPVDTRPQGASPYGCLNMAGNIWEWTRSVYRPLPYDPHDGREDPESSGPRTSRGGAWYTYSRSLRCSRRCPEIPTVRGNSFGFRVAASPAREAP